MTFSASLQHKINKIQADATRIDGIAQKFLREEYLGFLHGSISLSTARCRDENTLVMLDYYDNLIVFESYPDKGIVYIYFNYPGSEAFDGEDGGVKRLVFNASSLQELKRRIACVPVVNHILLDQKHAKQQLNNPLGSTNDQQARKF